MSIELLKVPEEAGLRRKMREAALRLVANAKIAPPPSIDTLTQYAGILLREHGISSDFHEFAMVLIGNETWRKTVEAIPFDRRLLLIPQCLKNKKLCKAKFDDYGLICEGCKNCSIDGILNKAEELGYATLVAEGTTVAVSLVEEGAIDAVIGVSCMAVLQRSFEPVSKAAIPVMGLPLLYDGCVDTRMDNKWLMEEIGIYRSNEAIQPISLSLLKNETQEYFTEKALKFFFPGQTSVEKFASEMMGMGGHRMRPLLGLLSYYSYSKAIEENIAGSLAMIIECFHKASLIHDDIEDHSDQRYHRDTLHKKHGVPAAINVGDYLIGKGYQLLSNMEMDDQIIAQCLRIVSNSHIQLTKGQGDDIMLSSADRSFSIDDAIEMFIRKTGESAKVALLLGAIAGEAPIKEIDVLASFADDFGVAYQIRDDLNEFEEENEMGKIHDFPFLMALINDHRKAHEGLDGDSFSEIDNVMAFRERVHRYQIQEKAGEILNTFIDNCYASLDLLQNQKMRLGLYGVLGKIFKEVRSNG
jgi:geranylgeranyl pyrophosphate synthase